jgi:hypothetical protein
MNLGQESCGIAAQVRVGVKEPQNGSEEGNAGAEWPYAKKEKRDSATAQADRFAQAKRKEKIGLLRSVP